MQARCVVIGGGPAGLMAAEVLVQAGVPVDLFDAMPSVGRKFLLAGKGGLNLTHTEPLANFVGRYGAHAAEVGSWLDAFGPQALRDWAQGLGIDTFVGSSGKVFPAEMKAAPLLRAWLHRLRVSGVRFHMRHRWNGLLEQVKQVEPVEQGDQGTGWTLAFDTPTGEQRVQAASVILALGGGSWARLGSDGAWQPWLVQHGVAVSPLKPHNCGFEVAWSAYLRERHAGAPLKNIRLKVTDRLGQRFDRLGEAVLTAHGLEGNLMYAASGLLRDEIEATGSAAITLDLLPARDEAELALALAKGRGARSMANHLREHAGLHGAKAALLHEGLDTPAWNLLSKDPARLAARIKALPLALLAPRPLDEAISSAGGVELGTALNEHLMLRALPGVFCAGEMLDWEAPTGGYLLTASLASGRVAAEGCLALG
ncbi:TIGR03862 family flavoprotein [Leptothrix ochracea]|uniref:TIGR03862 family flavoprotein n=1 Tax=Leptothrix ochracea TaxID=735331 RepID=UPI0034E2B659